ncbi:hypothetical protein F5Y19DRAFT_480274 [Xylariaceae sp. FL1651]|nr:hypothetical protein F5Y19DRAFT_480274 [Xylariaceae sp. FL1651]
MHQTACGELPVSYTQSTTAPELGGYCTTQSVGGPVGLTCEDTLYSSSPASQATETTEPVLTPTSDLPLLSISTELSPYPRLDSHSAAASSKTMWPTPPPDSPTVPTPGFQSGIHCPAGSAVASPRSWPSSEPQHLGFSQAAWRVPDHLPSYTMRICTSPFEDPFCRSLATSNYGSSNFNLHEQMDSESVAHDDVAAVPGMTEPSPVLSTNQESPGLKSEFTDAYQLGDDEEMHDLVAPPDQSEGDDGTKADEPYARLIYRAFMSRERHAMTLQEIYQWFRENTEKAKSESKGWQNSIRHNLSMNAAFVKRDRKSSSRDILSDLPETKKSTEWVLEDWAVRQGVQSTTRYRKGNPSRRGGSAAHHRAHGNISARASSGRKGGISASKTKAAATRRSMLSRTANPDLFSGPPEPVHNTMYNRPLNYHYTANSIGSHTTPADVNHPDMMFRNHMNTTTLPTTSNGHTYPYNGSISHNHMVSNYSQQIHPSTIYSLESVAGIYQEPQASAPGRIHGPNLPLTSGFDTLFANSTEMGEERATYIPWDGSAPDGGTYHA